MSNFDLRKYLAEGRLYKENVSPIKEGTINLSSEDNAIIDFVTNRAEELLSSGNYSDGELISKSPYKTADGKDATVEFYLKSYGKVGLGFLIPGKSDDLNDQKIIINTDFFGSAFGVCFFPCFTVVCTSPEALLGKTFSPFDVDVGRPVTQAGKYLVSICINLFFMRWNATS